MTNLANTTNPVINGFGDKYWYVNGELHRIDGPAIVHTDGTREYWLFGNRYEDKKVFEAAAAILVALFPEMSAGPKL